MNERTNERTDKRTNKQMNDTLTDSLTDWLAGWLGGWLAGWLTKWTNERIHNHNISDNYLHNKLQKFGWTEWGTGAFLQELEAVLQKLDQGPAIINECAVCKGRFTRYNFVACDKLTTSLRHESFRVNQTYNLLAIVVYDTKNVAGFWNMF